MPEVPVPTGTRFEIQIAGGWVYIPVRSEFNIEHGKEGAEEEIEFQIKWKNGAGHANR